MQITKTEEHGIRLVMRMAALNRQLTVAELARLENLPEPTVAKVLLQLKDGGVVVSERGRKGGYRLAAPPDQLSVGRVLDVLGNPLFVGRFCRPLPVPSERTCPRIDECGLRSVWHHLETMIMRVLAGTSLSDLLGKEESVKRHVVALWPGGGIDGPNGTESRASARNTKVQGVNG